MANITQDTPNDPSIIGEDIEPSVDLSDEELVVLANKWMQDAESYHDTLKTIQDKNAKYYFGNQTDMEEIPRYKSNVVENRIFMGIETVVPIITANTPQFVAMPAQETEGSAKASNAVQEILKINYEQRRVRQKLAVAVRHMLLFRFGVLKVYWDETIDDVNVKYVRPQRIWIPKYGENVDGIPAIIEKVDMDYDEIEEIFGTEGLKKVKDKPADDAEDKEDVNRTVTIWECWTNDFVFWKYGNEILKKMENPYFDFTGRTEETIDESGNAVVQDVFLNHFRKPRKPYVFMSPFKLGQSVVGDNDLVTQGIPLQDEINTLGRQIINNANSMGNATWLIDTDVMTEEEARTKITNEPGGIIYGPEAANPSKVRRDAPPPLPAYIPNAKLAAESSFDNIFGTHSTTRGERREPETLGGRLLLKQADVSRSSTFIDEIDNCVSDLGNWFTQLIKLYYEDQKTIRIYGQNGIEFFTFSKDNIEDGIEIIVKAGSTIQQDEVSMRNEAMMLWQQGAIDPITLFERLKFPNPQEAAERLVQWRMGKLMPSQEGVPPGSEGEAGAVQPNVNPQQEMREGGQSISGGF